MRWVKPKKAETQKVRMQSKAQLRIPKQGKTSNDMMRPASFDAGFQEKQGSACIENDLSMGGWKPEN